MSEVEVLEQELRTLGNAVNTRTIEIKARMKKAISNPKVQIYTLLYWNHFSHLLINLHDRITGKTNFGSFGNQRRTCVGLVQQRARSCPVSQNEIYANIIQQTILPSHIPIVLIHHISCASFGKSKNNLKRKRKSKYHRTYCYTICVLSW